MTALEIILAATKLARLGMDAIALAGINDLEGAKAKMAEAVGSWNSAVKAWENAAQSDD